MPFILPLDLVFNAEAFVSNDETLRGIDELEVLNLIDFAKIGNK